MKTPPLGEWIVNLGEAAEYIFDHIIFQDNLVFVDFCEQMVKETNPSVLAKAEKTEAPRGEVHGYRTIADIMRSYNPFDGRDVQGSAAHEPHRAGDDLPDGGAPRAPVHDLSGRRRHGQPTPTLFTDYLSRLLRCLDFIKKAVAMNDDVFDFFYEALPGYEEVGRRRILLGCWGAFNNPKHVDYDYRNMDDWGNEMFVTPGVVVDGELVTTNLVDINLGIRILLGSSYYEDWQNEETFVDKDPLGNPVDKRHPWNQTTIPKPQKRDLDGGNYSWVMSPRWYDKRTGDYLALDTGGGALARLWATALANKVHTPYVNATGDGVTINLPKTPNTPDATLEWKIPQWSNAIERDRARIYFVAYAAGMAMHFLDQGLERGPGGQHEGVRGLRRAGGGDRLRLPRGGARRALAPHGDPQREDRELPPVPADAVERQPDGLLRHSGALRGRCHGAADLRGERARRVQGHRHHAGGAELRPVPAVRRAHVPGRREDAQAGALADVRGPARRLGRRPWTTCRHGSWSRGWTPSWRRSRASPTRRPATRRPSWSARSSTSTGTGSRGWSRGSPTPEALGEDELVSHLLLLHGIHPVPVEARVRTALDEVRPYLDSHGGNVELVRSRTGRCGCGWRAAAAAARRRRSR